MAVTINIPGALREFADGQSRVVIDDSVTTLADALSALWQLHPGVRDRVVNEQGEVRAHINVFIGEEHIRYTGGLMSPVIAGSVITILPAVSGGRCSLSGAVGVAFRCPGPAKPVCYPR